MITILLSKICVFVLFLSILVTVKELFVFYQCFRKLERYEISNNRLRLLWFSLAYIMTIIFMGI